MDDHEGPALSYGEYGDAVFSVESQAWQWQRHDHDINLIPLGDIDEVVPAAAGAARHSLSQPKTTLASKILQRPNQLEPDLFLAKDLLPRSSRTSASITAALDIFDPLRGDMLASAHVKDGHGAADDLIRLTAYVTDQGRKEICVAKVTLQRQGWGSDKSNWIKVPLLSGLRGHWTSPSPIQQLASSGLSKFSAKGVFAVRTFSDVFILRVRVATTFAAFPNDGADRLEITVVGVVPTLSPSVSIYTCVAVNPWTPQCLAVIDSSGQWSIYETPKKHSSATLLDNARQILRGSIESKFPLTDCTSTVRIMDDGRLNIAWALDQHTLVVCSRRILQAIDVNTEGITEIKMEDQSISSGIWYLDMKVDPGSPNRLFLLTPTRLYSIYLKRPRIYSSHQKLRPTFIEYTISHRLRHFRDYQDETLQLAISSNGQETILLITSSLTSVINIYRYRSLDSSSSFLSISRSGLFTPPKNLDSQILLGLYLERIEKGARSEETVSRRKDKVAADMQYWSVLFFSASYGIWQQLYSDAKLSTQIADTIQAPSWRARACTSASKLAKDSFVAPDCDIDDAVQAMKVPNKSITPEIRVSTSKLWLNNHNVYRIISNEMMQGMGMSVLFSRIQQGLKAGPKAGNDVSARLLSNYIPGEIRVPDLDSFSNRFQNLVDICNNVGGNESTPESTPVVGGSIRTIANAQLLGLISTSPTSSTTISPLSIYNFLVTMYMSPLASDVPRELRLAREQLLRKAAVRLCLASHVLRYPNSALEDPTANTAQQEPNQGSSTPSSTPSQTRSTPSEAEDDSDSTTASVAISNPAKAALTRLAHYTAIKESQAQALPQTITSRVAAIIAHWGAANTSSPRDYNWQETTLRLAAQSQREEAEAGLTQKQRDRLERRRARSERRRSASSGRELELGRRGGAAAASSAPPPVLAGYPGLGSGLPTRPSSPLAGGGRGMGSSAEAGAKTGPINSPARPFSAPAAPATAAIATSSVPRTVTSEIISSGGGTAGRRRREKSAAFVKGEEEAGEPLETTDWPPPSSAPSSSGWLPSPLGNLPQTLPWHSSSQSQPQSQPQSQLQSQASQVHGLHSLALPASSQLLSSQLSTRPPRKRVRKRMEGF